MNLKNIPYFLARQDSISPFHRVLPLYLCIISLIYIATTPSHKAFAQGITACAGYYDAIITLDPEQFNAHALWRALEGDPEGYDRFYDATNGPGGLTIAAGVTSSRLSPSLSPYIMAFNPNGKVIWQVQDQTPLHETIHRIVYIDGQYVTLGDIEHKDSGRLGLAIGFYDLQGKLLNKKHIFDSDFMHHAHAGAGAGGAKTSPSTTGPNGQFDYTAIDLIQPRANISSPITLLASAQHHNDPDRQYAFLLQIDPSGEIIRRRNYQPGPANKLLGLTMLPDNTFIATGWIMQDNGRKAGWVARLGENGYLMWQRPYRRGRESSLNRAILHPHGGFVALGESDPAGASAPNDNKAAWAMWMDEDGQELWQRYWRSNYDLTAKDGLAPNGDHLEILIGAVSKDIDHRDHAKILTLTLRGQLIREDAFMEGGLTTPEALINAQGGHRAIIGYAQTLFSTGQVDASINIQSRRASEPGIYDAWLLMSPPAPPFQDPCAPNR